MGSNEDALAGAIQNVVGGDPHPVQFRGVPLMMTAVLYECSVCLALVLDQEGHRKNHDNHVAAHQVIHDEARRYKSPPTYGARTF